jgi:hypothetical protein
MNNCKKYQRIIKSYIEGELTEADKTQLEEHIKNCSACRKEYTKAQTLTLVVGESFQPETEEAVDSVMASISQLPVQDKETRSTPVFWKIAAGFIIIAGLLLGFQAGRTSMQWKPDNLTSAPYTIGELAGTVLVKHTNSDIWQPLTADSTIYIGDQFLSTPKAYITFAVDEKSSIGLKENSMLTLDITVDETNLVLSHGMLDADLESPHGPFFVTTPHGRAEALGTKFTVKVE